MSPRKKLAMFLAKNFTKAAHPDCKNDSELFRVTCEQYTTVFKRLLRKAEKKEFIKKCRKVRF